MKSEKQRGGHEGGGCAQGVGCAPTSWAPRGSPDLVPSPIYTLIPQKHQGDPPNHFFAAATFCTREIPSRGLFRRPAGGGFDHRGLLHQFYYPSDEA